MITTTLNRIKACNPGAPFWDALLQDLGKTCSDDAPLSYAQILRSCGLEARPGRYAPNRATTACGRSLPSNARASCRTWFVILVKRVRLMLPSGTCAA